MTKSDERAEQQRTLEKVRLLVRQIQAAKSDSEAEILGEQLIETMFGPQQDPRA